MGHNKRTPFDGSPYYCVCGQSYYDEDGIVDKNRPCDDYTLCTLEPDVKATVRYRARKRELDLQRKGKSKRKSVYK